MSKPADIAQDKAALRSRMQKRLREMPSDQRRAASNAACQRIIGLEAFRHAATVMIYMPLADEIELSLLAIRCFETGKSVCVPRVDWERKDMKAVEITNFDDNTMDVDEHGLRTPRDGAPVMNDLIDMVIVPGLAFDTAGNRLGRGGGFYDRFLRRLRRSAAVIAVGFDFQIVDDVPVEDHDALIDMVVTDRRATPTGSAKPQR